MDQVVGQARTLYKKISGKNELRKHAGAFAGAAGKA